MFFTNAEGNWRNNVTNSALIGANVLILFLGIKLQARLGWYLGFGLIGLTSFWAWYANLKRYRTVADTPTSRIASAPQGYIEVVGRGQHHPGSTPLVSRFTGLPCLWYRYVVERKNDDEWEQVESGETSDTFALNDGSGHLLIDPDGAEILISKSQIINREGYRIIEWTLIAGETLYVIGEHVSLGGPHAQLDKHADISTLLSEWKRNKSHLLARFDANRDGEISLDEWENARHAAAAEVDRTHFNIRLDESIHLIRKPARGRPFLIANRDVTALVRHFRIWSWVHLAVLLVAVSGLAWLGRLP